MALRGSLFLGLIEAAVGMATCFFVLASGGWSQGQVLGPDETLHRRATAAYLTAIAVLQVVTVYLCHPPAGETAPMS